MAAKSGKNFVTTNAIANITSIPKKPVPKYVDTNTGATHRLEESGLMPKYVHKKEYGEVPQYLQQHRKEMAEAQASYERSLTNKQINNHIIHTYILSDRFFAGLLYFASRSLVSVYKQIK